MGRRFITYSLGVLACVGSAFGGAVLENRCNLFGTYDTISSLPVGESVSESEMKTLRGNVGGGFRRNKFVRAMRFDLEKVSMRQDLSDEGKYSLRIDASCQKKRYSINLILGEDGERRDRGKLYFEVGGNNTGELANR